MFTQQVNSWTRSSNHLISSFHYASVFLAFVTEYSPPKDCGDMPPTYIYLFVSSMHILLYKYSYFMNHSINRKNINSKFSFLKIEYNTISSYTSMVCLHGLPTLENITLHHTALNSSDVHLQFLNLHINWGMTSSSSIIIQVISQSCWK